MIRKILKKIELFLNKREFEKFLKELKTAYKNLSKIHECEIRIMRKMKNFPNLLSKRDDENYILFCSCGDLEHYFDFVLLDKENPIWEVCCIQRVYNDKKTKNKLKNLFYEIIWRIKKSFQILFKGYVESFSEFLIDEKNLDAFKLISEKIDKSFKEKEK